MQKKKGIVSISSLYEFDNYIVGIYEDPIENVEYAKTYIFDKKRNKLILNSANVYSNKLKINMWSLLPKFNINENLSTVFYPDQIQRYINDTTMFKFSKEQRLYHNV